MKKMKGQSIKAYPSDSYLICNMTNSGYMSVTDVTVEDDNIYLDIKPLPAESLRLVDLQILLDDNIEYNIIVNKEGCEVVSYSYYDDYILIYGDGSNYFSFDYH